MTFEDLNYEDSGWRDSTLYERLAEKEKALDDANKTINEFAAELNKCNQLILKQQLVIKGLRDCVHMLDSQYLESGIYDVDLSTIETH